MSGWQECKLGDIAERIGMGPFGSNIRISTFVSEGVPVISGTHLRGIRLEDKEYNFITLDHANKLQSANVSRGDVIFTHAGNIGQVAFIPNNSKYERYIISQRQFYLRAKRDILSPEYLTYYFKSEEGQHKLLANANQTGVPSLAQPVSYLKTIEIILPPLSEQRAIAGVLSSLDDKIDLLHRQNKTLESMAEALWRKMFVEDADPNWAKGKLGDIVAVSTGKGLKRNEYIEGGLYPVLGANGEIGRTNKYLTDEKIILTGRVGTLGGIFISNKKVWISDNVLIVKPNEHNYFYQVYFLLRNIDFENLNVGSTQPLVTQTDLKNVEIEIPSVDILDHFTAFCESIFNKVEKNIIQIRMLSRLRDTLLPKLMSGEVRLKM